MMMATRHRWPGVVAGLVLLAGLFLLAGVAGARAQDGVTSPSVVDEIEAALELGWHERLLKVQHAKDARLAPFVTDGCSGGQSAGWELMSAAVPAFAARHGNLPPWEQCCVTHDRAYHRGAPPGANAEASFMARRAADERLRQCVLRVGQQRIPALMSEYGLSPGQASLLYRNIADAMYRAVRLGGGPCTGLSWRWGYGWPSCHLFSDWLTPQAKP